METHPWQALLQNPEVLSYLTKAWQDSNPDTIDAHEEGGFVVRNSEGGFEVIRWGQGTSQQISVPSHRGCRIDDKEIVASFHTHPHSTAGYEQAPTDTDIRSVKRDRNLKGVSYLGEFVVSLRQLFFIDPFGHVSDVGNTAEVLRWKETN